MFKFLTGVIVGWFLGSWYTHNGRMDAEQMRQFRAKASQAMNESARIVDRSRRELQQAVSGGEAGRGQ